MKHSIRSGLIVLAVMLFVSAASAESFTVLTYNLGLLKPMGINFVPIVDARSTEAPRVLASANAGRAPSIILLEEVWKDATADAIAQTLAPLGYTAVKPAVRTILGLNSGLVLLVKPPVRVVEWSFTAFKRNTFLESFATRKGVFEATLENADTGRRFVLVGTHTVAVDTKNNEPVDKKQVSVFEAQADQILAALKARSADGTIPALLLGDFNVGPGYADGLYRRIADSGALREAGDVLLPGAPLITWDPGNPLVKYGNYPNEPPAKIDHVFMQDSPDAQWEVNTARVVFTDPAEGLSLVPKKDALKRSGETAPVACPLSDHYGFLAELELNP